MSEKQPQPEQPERPDESQHDIEEIVELVNSNPWNQDPGPWAADEEAGDIYSIEIRDDGQIESAERLRHPRPMVWIACLAAYNDGNLHGEWVDAAVEDDVLHAAAQRVLASSPVRGAEEHAIFDTDEFGAFRVGEYERLETVARVARGIKEHGHAFGVWAQLHDADPDILDGFEDAFLGEYESPEAWAREVLDDLNLDGFLRLGAIPESIRPYLHVDYEGWARDAELSGDVNIEPTPEGRIFVFSTR
ncbi:antirestriction protein ArdA [Nocardioides sp.]|uniref:antirestriction protein ArdA n=1 Tax=Nocardioides sp. TaxID=35761 RepID=UPI002BDEBA20|nr:antirestriction protein ArdA [Nocardioides sp.]HSX65944.1 antirestriction protein ArdA [Nocardioides sp.]